MVSLIGATQILLALTLIVGFYTTWYSIYQNGTIELMRDVRDRGPHILPGTKAPLKKSYVGIGWIDYQLTVLTLFFWEAVDGSRPAASLFCFGFAGQAAAAWSILYVDGRRLGNRWKLVSFITCWGIAIQLYTFAVFMPLYLIIHLATSPTVSSRVAKNYAVDVPNLLSVPISLIIGFVLPSVLLSLPAPSVLSFDQKQTFIAFWQMFPIWFEILQQLFSFVLAKLLQGTLKSSTSPQKQSRRTMEALRSVYIVALAIAGVTHVTAVMLSMTSMLFPALFAPQFQGELNPSNVFLTQSFFASKSISSIGAGALQLLQYDDMVGSIALQLWAVALYLNSNSRTSKVDSWTAIKVVSAFVASTVLFGSCGCAVCFIWARDELVFAEKEDDDRKSL